MQFIGFGGVFKAFYSVEYKQFTHALAPISRDYISKRDRDNSVMSLTLGLNITYGSYSEMASLNHSLKTKRAVYLYHQPIYY